MKHSQVAPSDVDTMSVRSFPSEHSVSSGFGAMIEEKYVFITRPKSH